MVDSWAAVVAAAEVLVESPVVVVDASVAVVAGAVVFVLATNNVVVVANGDGRNPIAPVNQRVPSRVARATANIPGIQAGAWRLGLDSLAGDGAGGAGSGFDT
ncbi:MAG: hypothetical protein WD313_03915, partial [Acidimicrobiia bacterium]